MGPDRLVALKLGGPLVTNLRTTNLGRALCLGGASLGAIGLIGWLTGADALVTIVPGQPPMMPNTALALLLLGIAGALRDVRHPARAKRLLSLMAAVIVLAIGLGTIAEYAFRLPFSIDQLLVRSDVGPYPGRPSPPTAFALTCLAAAILLLELHPDRRTRPSEWLILCAGLIAFTALLGQLFGAGALYQLIRTPIIGVAVHTSLSLLMTSVGLLLEQPDVGLMRVATSSGPGGLLVRRLAPVAILVPVLFGLIAAWLVAVPDLEDVSLIFAALIAISGSVSLLLLTTTAEHLNHTHDDLEQSRSRTRDLIQLASDGIFIADIEGRYVDVNDAGCQMLGYSREEILGKTILDLIPPEDEARLHSDRAQFMQGGSAVSEWRLLTKDQTYLPVEVSAKILPGERWLAFVRDVSERKRAEEKLRQAQERLDLALKGADLAAWDWNIKTGEVIFNARWAEMRGFRPEEIRPHVDSWIAGVHPDDLAGVQKVLSDHFEGVLPEYETTHRVSTKNGEWIWIFDRGKVFGRDELGRPTRMVGTELDVTAQKRADAKLRLSEAKFSGIVSVSADAIISIDEDQRITLFNEGAEKIFGRSSADVIGVPLDILIPERFRAIHRRHVENFATGADIARRMGTRGGQIFGVRKNGEEFPADAAISGIVIGGKRILTVALRDVTEQKRAETEQRLLAELGAVLAETLELENTLTNIARLIVRDLADYCIVDVVEDDGNIRRARVVCQDPSKAWVCDALMRTPLDGEQPRLTGPVLVTRQGHIVRKVTPDIVSSWARNEEERTALQNAAIQSAIATPLLAHGKLLGALVLMSEKTARAYGPADLRIAEAIAQRAAFSLENARLYRAAKRATQARDDMLGIVAHDLRNPLAAIVALASVLRKHETELETAEEISNAANRMNRLIQDLLDVTRMEAGRFSLRRERLEATEAISDSLEAQTPLASSASIELRLDAAPELPAIWADHDRLLQVFENLIGNAIKFTKPGGRITLGATPRAGEVLFSVADTGCGIATTHLPHVFDRFWQASEAPRRGTGLGLAIVKGIVEAHDGSVWVQSSPDQGSTFFFTIPAAASKAAAGGGRRLSTARHEGSTTTGVKTMS
jgi:PAS domain S-box-containing protein